MIDLASCRFKNILSTPLLRFKLTKVTLKTDEEFMKNTQSSESDKEVKTNFLTVILSMVILTIYFNGHGQCSCFSFTIIYSDVEYTTNRRMMYF